MKEYSIHPKAQQFHKETHFNLFKYEGYICLVARMSGPGHFCGYVGVKKTNKLFGKSYSDYIEYEKKEDLEFNGNYLALMINALKDSDGNEVSIDLLLNVHGGITYSKNKVSGIDENIFNDLWWFGFDTAHAGDVRPIENYIDRKYRISEDEYRDLEYMEAQTKKLAEQLKNFEN